MKCRQCGYQIPEKLKQREVIQCPRCGKKYQRRQKRPPKSRSGKFRPLLVAGLVLFLILDGVLLSLAATGKISLGRQEKEQTAAETWPERFARTEGEVARYIDEVILSSCALSLETHLACDAEEDVYYAYVNPVLDPADGASFRRAVRQITERLQEAPVPITMYITFMNEKNRPLCVTCLGHGYDEFSFVMNAKMYTVPVNDIPNDIFEKGLQ